MMKTFQPALLDSEETEKMSVVRMSGGRNLCSLHECVADKSSFLLTNYRRKKVKNEEILPSASKTGCDECDNDD